VGGCKREGGSGYIWQCKRRGRQQSMSRTSAITSYYHTHLPHAIETGGTINIKSAQSLVAPCVLRLGWCVRRKEGGGQSDEREVETRKRRWQQLWPCNSLSIMCCQLLRNIHRLQARYCRPEGGLSVCAFKSVYVVCCVWAGQSAMHIQKKKKKDGGAWRGSQEAGASVLIDYCERLSWQNQEKQ